MGLRLPAMKNGYGIESVGILSRSSWHVLEGFEGSAAHSRRGFFSSIFKSSKLSNAILPKTLLPTQESLNVSSRQDGTLGRAQVQWNGIEGMALLGNFPWKAICTWVYFVAILFLELRFSIRTFISSKILHRRRHATSSTYPPPCLVCLA